MTDTTERPLADTAQHLADIVASSGDAIIGQTLDGVVTCWNGAAARLLGWPAAAILGRSIALVVPAGRDDAERQILFGLRAGGRVAHAETERLRQDGTLVPVAATFSPIRHADGGLAGISTILRDLRQHAAVAVPQPAEERPVPADAGPRRTTMLLVEDDAELLELLQETLSSEGYEVIVASDGRTALGLLVLHPEVAAVVSDIVMPNGVSGVLLAREAQRLRPDLPVLLMSGYPREEIGRLGNIADLPLLTKPFRPAELTRQMRLLLH